MDCKSTTCRHFKITALLIFAFVYAFSCAYAQKGKKPTLMILPSDHWCSQRIYTTTFNDQGTKVVVPDYQTAFQQDYEIKGVIAKLGQTMTSLGYSIKDCEQELKNISTRTAEGNIAMSKGGAFMEESPLDILKRKTKTDIILQIDWEINKLPDNMRSVTFSLEAFDSYTSKRIATAYGTTRDKENTMEIPVLLENAVKEYVSEFNLQLVSYFKEQEKNGREILLTVKKWDSWENDLETEYDGEELTDCIQKWLRENTVKSSFSLSDGTESFAQFEQVKIPLFDENGNAMDARAFATKLRKYLQKPPFEISSKVMVRGLGEAIIVLGEK